MPVSWQTLPLSLDPIAGYIGSVPVTWYAVMYLSGAVCAALYFIWRGRCRRLLPSTDISIEVILSILWGVIIGARLGYVFFYGGSEFLTEPWRVISPYDFGSGEWIGIRGMSFHGGLIGGALGLLMFTREGNRNFLQFSDLAVETIPIAIVFGRVGNFLNQEILGRVVSSSSTSTWGMYFPGGGSLLLHPVTLYEAAAEGVLLFIIMAIVGRFSRLPGRCTAYFLFFYAGIRYVAENYRAAPSTGDMVLGIWSMGQALSLGMILLGLAIFLWPRRHVV